MKPRMQELYRAAVVPALQKKFNYTNVHQVPRLVKVVINMGMGKAVAEPKLMDTAVSELSKIAGQKPVVTKAKKAISNFKLRQGVAIGCKVTLRQHRMYEFFDRLCSIALPRVRDFRGVSDRGFDKNGNYTLGIRDHTIFPEINLDKVDVPLGMNITFVTTAHSKDESRELLAEMGMPFRQRS